MSLLFLAAAGVAIAGGVGVVLSRQPVHSVLALVINFIGLAVLFLSLQAEFLAVIQIIVYAGAVMVLFLFVIALLTVKAEYREATSVALPGQRAAGVVVAAGLAGVLGIAGLRAGFGRAPAATLGPPWPSQIDASFGTVPEFGRWLLNTHVLPFEMMALVLMVAVVGVVILVGRRDVA